MSNFEQDSAHVAPTTQQSPLFNKDSFPGAEHCIASHHGLPIPVDAAEFPWFDDFAQATLTVEILDIALADLRNFTARRSRGVMYICDAIRRAADKFAAQPSYSAETMHDIATKLITYIAMCLAPEDAYGDWLSLQLPASYRRDSEQAMSARVQWVEWMITHVEGNIKQLEENETAACTQQEVYLNTPARWLTTK